VIQAHVSALAASLWRGTEHLGNVIVMHRRPARQPHAKGEPLALQPFDHFALAYRARQLFQFFDCE